VVDVAEDGWFVAAGGATGQLAQADEFVECSAGSASGFGRRSGCGDGFGCVRPLIGPSVVGRQFPRDGALGGSVSSIVGIQAFAMQLRVGWGLRGRLLGDDVHHDVAGAVVVDGIGALRVVAGAGELL